MTVSYEKIAEDAVRIIKEFLNAGSPVVDNGNNYNDNDNNGNGDGYSCDYSFPLLYDRKEKLTTGIGRRTRIWCYLWARGKTWFFGSTCSTRR